jgi:biopolymer transport protein ExbB/TolQ
MMMMMMMMMMIIIIIIIITVINIKVMKHKDHERLRRHKRNEKTFNMQMKQNIIPVIAKIKKTNKRKDRTNARAIHPKSAFQSHQRKRRHSFCLQNNRLQYGLKSR